MNNQEALEKCSNYCPVLWQEMTIDSHGYIIFCCHSSKHGHAHISKVDDLFGFFNNNLYTEARKLLWEENKIHPACESCINRNNKNIATLRTYKIQDKNIEVEVENYDKQVIKSLELSFSNLCNQQCVMCNSTYSSQWLKDDQRLEDSKFKRNPEKYDYALTGKDLDKILQIIDYIEELNIKGGEPTIDPNFISLIDYLVKHDPKKRIRVVSNFQKVSAELMNNLTKLENLQLIVSLDGTKEIYNWIRGGNYEKTVKNVIEFSNKSVNPIIGFTTAFTAYNLFHLKDFVIEIEELNQKLNNKSKTWIAMRYVEHPKYVSPLILPCEERTKYFNELAKILDFSEETMPKYKSIKIRHLDQFKNICTNEQIDGLQKLSIRWKEEIDNMRGKSLNVLP